MLVESGRVVARGSNLPTADGDAVNLQGAKLFPSFIDNHCHILPTGLDLQKLHLGSCQSNQEVLGEVRNRLCDIQDGKWLQAVHYDQTKFGGVFLTRQDLDKVSESTPISLRHVNGHASVVNTAALVAASISDAEADPSGGSFGRDDAGRVNGVLFESAHEKVSQRAPMPTLEEMVDAILRAGNAMAEFGICCASDMMTGRFDLLRELQAYRIAAEKGCPIMTRLYLQWGEVFRREGGWRSEEIREAIEGFNRSLVPSPTSPVPSQISGIKIFADGAIGSATAAVYGNYSGEKAAGFSISRHAKDASGHTNQDVSGQLIYAPDRLNEMVKIADQAGFQVAIHTIGDYSTDLVMDAFEQVDDPSRHRIEHAMLLSDSQIERMAKLGCFCTMQPEFLMRFDHSYKRQLGSEKTWSLKRFRSVKDAGIPLSFSSDRPIVLGNPLDGIRVATNRPEGFDPNENLSEEECIDAYTVEAAKPTGDASDLGGLESGQFVKFRCA